MSKSETFTALRIIPRADDYLDRKLGSRGEIFFDQTENTLRLFDGNINGGISLAKADLSNIPNLLFKAKAEASGIIASTTVNDSPPASPSTGELWFDTVTGTLFIYYNDGTSSQWVQPSSPVLGGGGALDLNGLSDVTITTPVSGQVLKYNGTAWVNGVDLAGSGSGSLNDITDVQISSVATDQLLRYDGVQWSNSSVSTFSQISVTGQSTVVADSLNDTLTLVAGAGISLTTNASADSVTITSTVSNFSNLTEPSTASLTVDRIYLPAITMLEVTNSGASAYRFDQYGNNNNPTIYAISGTTIAFNLQSSGHPFQIQTGAGTNFNTGLVHVSTTGVVSTGSNAQGKDSGTLYWKIPESISGGYRYQCSLHGAMVGSITVKSFLSV